MNAKTAILVLAACAPTATPAAERVEPEQAPAPAPAVLVEESSPAADPSGPTFHLVAEVVVAGDDGQKPYFRVFRAADGELFASVGPLVIPIAADGSFERDSKWLHGMDAFRDAGPQGLFAVATWGVVAAAGRWPDGFYLTISAEFGYRGAPYSNWVYRRDNDRWIELKNKRDRFHAFPTDLAPWKDGSVLALRGFEPIHEVRGSESDETAEPTQASVRLAAAAIARQKPLIVIRGAAKAPDLGRRDVAAIDALATGEIVGVVEGETPLAVHFDPARAAVTERALPERSLADAEVLLEGPARAWIYGRSEGEPAAAYLARFDGATWHEEPAPPCRNAGIGSYARTPEGDAWAVCGLPPNVPQSGETNTLWHRSAGAHAWTQARLPAGAEPAEVIARGSDDVWVAGNALFHTRARDEVVATPGYAGLWLDAQEHDPVAAFSCESGTILVEGAVGGAHQDLVAAFDRAFPLDHNLGLLQLVEVDVRGDPHLALQHNMLERKARDRIRQVLGDRMRESYCLQRDPIRKLGSW